MCWKPSSPVCPPPKGDVEPRPLKALLVDAWYDAYLGVVVLVRVFDGRLRVGAQVRMMQTGATYRVDKIGVFQPKATEVDFLGAGEIGFITAQIKDVADAAVGETITEEKSRRPPRPYRGSSRCSRWCSAACFRWTRPISRTCARRSAVCA